MTTREKGACARLFLALWPTPAVRAGLLAWRDGIEWPPGASPVPADELHLTLHIIGAVPRAALDELLPVFAAPVPAFELRFGRPELWPGGLAVLSPNAVPDALLSLHATLREALQRAGLRTETRPFRPHVTLARRARGAIAPTRSAGLRWPANDGYVLAQSLPGSAGYEIVERFA